MVQTSGTDLTAFKSVTVAYANFNLNLQYNSISSLSGLSGGPNDIYDLDLEYNPFSDLTPLEGLTKIYYLYLEYTQVSVITPLDTEFATGSHYVYLYGAPFVNSSSAASEVSALDTINPNVSVYY